MLNGLDVATNARQDRRGGGVAIVVNTECGLKLKKLHVNCSEGGSRLETVWGWVSHTKSGGLLKHYICVSFYSPPNTRLNAKLLEHLTFNLTRLSFD